MTPEERQQHLDALKADNARFAEDYERSKDVLSIRFAISKEKASDILFYMMSGAVPFISRKPEVFP
jgi:hypothetical protein